MPRPYRDAVELLVTELDRSEHPLVVEGTVILRGTAHPAVDGPVPVMLSPGHEYRVRQVTTDGETYWVMERRSG